MALQELGRVAGGSLSTIPTSCSTLARSPSANAASPATKYDSLMYSCDRPIVRTPSIACSARLQRLLGTLIDEAKQRLAAQAIAERSCTSADSVTSSSIRTMPWACSSRPRCAAAATPLVRTELNAWRASAIARAAAGRPSRTSSSHAPFAKKENSCPRKHSPSSGRPPCGPARARRAPPGRPRRSGRRAPGCRRG